MKPYEILWNINNMLAEADSYKKAHNKNMKWRIADVCDDLGIFDWWNEYLSVSQLKQMKKFLETAIDLGYEGYACFKVGASYCSHGMWANKAESTDGYSPKGECLYHSFRSGDNYWDAKLADGTWAGTRDSKTPYEYKESTLKEIKALIYA